MFTMTISPATGLERAAVPSAAFVCPGVVERRWPAAPASEFVGVRGLQWTRPVIAPLTDHNCTGVSVPGPHPPPRT